MHDLASSGSIRDRLRAFGRDPAAVLDVDVPCFKCGYNVRGLLPGATCPECGHSVDDSVRDAADRPEPEWLMVLRKGIDLALLAVGSCVLSLVLLVISFGAGASGLGCSVFLLLVVSPGAAGLAAIWFSQPEPMREDKAYREMVRGAAVLMMVSYVLAFGFNMVRWRLPAEVMAMLCAAMAILAIGAATYWARHVARRIRANRLARSVFLVGWGDTIVGVIGAWILLTQWYFAGSDSSYPLVTFSSAMLPLWSVALFWFGVATVVLMVGSRVALSRAMTPMRAVRRGGGE